MADYLKLFRSHEEYEEYISHCEPIEPLGPDEMPQEPPKPNHVIFYKASAKLSETTSEKTSGLHTNAFGQTILLHDFSDGAGMIIFTNNVTYIGSNAFYGTSIKSVSVPSTVSTLYTSAFSSCTSLQEIYMYPATPTTQPTLYTTNNLKIYVPSESVAAYKTSWRMYANYIVSNNPAFRDRWLELDNTCIDCSLYEQKQHQVSYDSGATWQNDGDVVKTMIEYHSASCGYAERWVDDGSGCTGFNLYEKEKKQVSHDSGATWEDTGEVRDGALIEELSESCGYDPTIKTNIITYYASSKLVENTTSGYGRGLHVNSFNTPIMNHAFKNGVGTIVFENEVTSLGNYAFQQCYEITNIEIPETVTEIGNNAFDYCSGLTSVNIPSGVTSIGGSMFSGCANLKRLNSDTDGVFNIPSQITNINGSAFYGCTSLTSCTIPDSVTSIGSSSFQNCRNLVNINIPTNITSIEYNAFDGCDSLPVVDNIRYADTYAVEPVNGSQSSYRIKDGTIYIGYGMFLSSTTISSISIPSSVKYIEPTAFGRCASLVNITIPDTVTSIGWGAFMDCMNLQTIVIGSGVTSIGGSAVAMPYCSSRSITSIIIKAVIPPTLGIDAFNYTNDCPIYVPAESVEAYKTATNWSTYASRIQAIT
jgi:hypothetical protein